MVYLSASTSSLPVLPIAARAGWEIQIPAMQHTIPKTVLRVIAVRTVFSTAFWSFAPSPTAAVTFAPTEQPINMFIKRFISAVVVPIAPTASGSLERLTGRLARRVTAAEYRAAVSYMRACGITDGFVQERTSAEEAYTPAFDGTGV